MDKLGKSTDLDQGMLRIAVKAVARIRGIDYQDAHQIVTEYQRCNPLPEEIGRRQRQLGKATAKEAREHYHVIQKQYQSHHGSENLAPNFAA